MIPQKNNELRVLQRDEFDGRIRTIQTYLDLNHFLSVTREDSIRDLFRISINRKITDAENPHVLIDVNDEPFPTDWLIHESRKWTEWRIVLFHKRTQRFARKSAWRNFRNIRTFQERKWFHAWDDEEFAPKGRASRGVRAHPSNWDDIYGHNDKCWKTQSRRKNQWKANL